MTSKIVLFLLPVLASSEFSFNTPQVYEPEIITASSQFSQYDLQTEASNIQPIYTAPPHFNFQEYQKGTQLDPRKHRYIQQQKSDQFHANEQYHANYRDSRNDQQFQAKQESSVGVQAPVGQNWKVIHPKFVTENVKDYVTVTGIPTTMMEYQNTNPAKQQNLLEKEEDLKKTDSYEKITPTLVPTEESSRQVRVYKKSLLPNSYQLENKEAEQIPLEDRQDVGNLPSYVRYLNPDLNQDGKKFNRNQDQLSALTSLLGKHPNVQLQGLNQLLGNQSPVYNKNHVPIHENQQERNNQRHHNNQKQNYPTLNNNALENAIIAQTQAIQQSGSTNPQSFSSLQAQLDATAKLHADKIIAEAQQKALEHVQAQHKAIALAQVQAEKMALAQVQAQNEELERAHAEAQAKAEQVRIEQDQSNVDEKKQQDTARLQRLTEEHRRFQEQVRQQALKRKLREREEREQQEALRQQQQQKKSEPLPDTSALQQDAASVAQKTRQKTHNKISPAASQNQYYHQVPSYGAPAEVPYKPPSIHTITLNAPKSPVKHTNTKLYTMQTPSESFVNVNAAGYNQHTKSEEADVSKYFVPPQVTAEEYKNAKGEHDLLYAAKYAFGYRIRDYHNGNDFGHEEAKEGGQTKGHYHVLLPDGRVQNVHYIADDDGFHAKVSYSNGIASNAEDDDVSK